MSLKSIAGLVTLSLLPVVSGSGSADATTVASASRESEQVPQALTPGRDWTVEETRVLVRGQTLYAANCTGCHKADGTGMPLFDTPSLHNNAVASGPKTDYIRLVITGHNKMPGFGQWLDDADLAVLLSYVRNAWGNTGGDLITSAEVRAARTYSTQ